MFVSTGTGSGKTECFLWPMIAKLVTEAHDSPNTWQNRGVRAIIMYPMNALVSDQLSRLRRLIGDTENKFVAIFRETCGQNVRRPQFGMYTGRTPYPGFEPKMQEDHRLEKTLARMAFAQNDDEKKYFENLVKEGKVPAKSNMVAFLERLHNGVHIPDDEDAELVTRFEMQQFCPDILITNYSMLEYMLLRPREQKIWNDTEKWLKSNPDNKLLFVIDEAHMYRGSSGGEVALLIRRMLYKLGVNREKVQFILTTASMPNASQEDYEKVIKFARDLTSSEDNTQFRYLTGERENVEGKAIYQIPFGKFEDAKAEKFENEDTKLAALNEFWKGIDGAQSPFSSLATVSEWMYRNLVSYEPFSKLIQSCRGTAVSLQELAMSIFPETNLDSALNAVSVLQESKAYMHVQMKSARIHILTDRLH